MPISPPSALLPSFSVCMRITWQEFRARFRVIALLILVFSTVNLALQLSFFGAVAWGSFIDYLSGETAVTSFGALPLFVSLAGASPWVVIPVIALTLAQQVWFHASLTATIQGTTRTLREALRQGRRAWVRVAALLAMMFVAVRLAYFIMVLLAGFVLRYVGSAGTSAELINRVLLLIFACTIIAVGIVGGFSFFRTFGGTRNPFIALREAVCMVWRQPWGIFWRAAAVLFMLYVVQELAALIQLRSIPLQWHTLLALVFLPFLLCFLHVCYSSLSHEKK